MTDFGTTEISGDIPLSTADRFRYLWRNALHNLTTFGRGPATRPFIPAAESLFGITTQSPSRLLTEAWFAAVLPTERPAAGPVEVLEIGCGSGSLAGRLAGLGYSGRYTGIDIGDRFRHDQPVPFPFEVTFVRIDARSFTPARPIDLLVSVSALEHIAGDADLIRRLSAHMAPGGLEVHAVPAGAALITYLWHGYRQYTPATLAERFGTKRTEIFRLGGFGSFLLHVLLITPEILFRRFVRARAPGLYRRLLRGALAIDRVLPFCATAYVVIRRH